jgi:hypothetical protein
MHTLTLRATRLPPAVADKAYARGNALKIDEVVTRLQAIAESLAL